MSCHKHGKNVARVLDALDHQHFAYSAASSDNSSNHSKSNKSIDHLLSCLIYYVDDSVEVSANVEENDDADSNADVSQLIHTDQSRGRRNECGSNLG